MYLNPFSPTLYQTFINIPITFLGDQPRRAQKSVDSHNRLFGQSDRPFTPAKNHMKSNIPLGHNGNLTNGKSNGHHLNGNSDTGSLSSSTSSIASSNDNFKMNGFSRTGWFF